MRKIMRGEVSPAQIAAILIGLRVKKETVGEIAGGGAGDARVRRPGRREGPTEHLVDIVGTGGDGAHTFNISTARDVRRGRGGRARSPSTATAASRRKSGSADVLEALGAKIELAPEQVARCIDEVGIGFMFAPIHHPAMKHVGAGAQGAGRAHDLQHPRPADQSRPARRTS